MSDLLSELLNTPQIHKHYESPTVNASEKKVFSLFRT